jgi:beta-glucosidase-like glycosyl hydrolase/CubicO group peptidase (beta-lactamase class C family)
MRKTGPFLWQFILLMLLFPLPGSGNEKDSCLSRREFWVDSVYHSLTPAQRIAQLMIIRVYSNRGSAYEDSITRLIRLFNPGGICFFRGSPTLQARFTNRLQSAVQTPLITAIDAECGLGMRLDSAFRFPYSMTLGAVANDSLIFQMATVIARDCRRMGIHLNLAPVVDVNNNPGNPVINIRSFGEDAARVALLGTLYVHGLQSGGIIATGKHFPGHGDTDTDSHFDLPVIPYSRERLDSLELVPFKALIREKAGAIMTAHLYVPCLDSTSRIAATLSRGIITGLLKNELGYRGFVITDALDMKGITSTFPPGKAEVQALLAGTDILLLPENLPVSVTSVAAAVEDSIISASRLENKCRNLLGLKFDLGLEARPYISTDNLVADLNPEGSKVLAEEIYKSGITVVKNHRALLPLGMLQKRKIATLSIGDTMETPFQTALSWYAPFTHFHIPKTADPVTMEQLRTHLSGFDILILGVHRSNLYPANNFGIPEQTLEFIRMLIRKNRTILVIFGNPYILKTLGDVSGAEAIVVTYQDSETSEKVAAEILFGGVGASGRLPVSVPGFPAGTCVPTEVNRLEFVRPEEIGISSFELQAIDSMAAEGITAGAFPGCQILFARNGKVFYYKAFGNPRYGDSVPVRTTDLYDIASLTKVMATTLAVMKLSEQGKIEPDRPFSDWLPELRGTNKERITVREAMAHQSGFQPWIPFYELTLKEGTPDPEIFDTIPSASHPLRVADRMYISGSYTDSIIRWIVKSDLRLRKDYKYSDLGFILLKQVVERITRQDFETWLTEQFYLPMGLTTMGFHPLDRFPRERIMPAEYDSVFRHMQLWGDVDDQAAALSGGISGHAGLFSDAFDLAVVLQMLLNTGEYGGKQYLLPSTIREFTSVQYPGTSNRRGLGFDKPETEGSPNGPACHSASPLSFGHSGFTGSYAWADPENGLVYVFLSNRVYPDPRNARISTMNIRTNIHQKMYDILEKVPVK